MLGKLGKLVTSILGFDGRRVAKDEPETRLPLPFLFSLLSFILFSRLPINIRGDDDSTAITLLSLSNFNLSVSLSLSFSHRSVVECTSLWKIGSCVGFLSFSFPASVAASSSCQMVVTSEGRRGRERRRWRWFSLTQEWVARPDVFCFTSKLAVSFYLFCLLLLSLFTHCFWRRESTKPLVNVLSL